MAGFVSGVYKILRAYNTVRSVSRSIETGSPRPVVHRLGRRVIGRGAGRLSSRLFPPVRRRR